MTIYDLPPRLRVEGVQIANPNEKVVVHIPESNMVALEQINKRMLLEKQPKESA